MKAVTTVYASLCVFVLVLLLRQERQCNTLAFTPVTRRQAVVPPAWPSWLADDSQKTGRTPSSFLSAAAGDDGGDATTTTSTKNEYDQWLSDGVARLAFPLTEENVVECLEIFMESEYGQQMFGRHEKAADIGITGSIGLEEIEGPVVLLSLEGAFWHKRSTVLGKAAIWLNACMPEIMQVNVSDPEQLEDFEDYRDEDTGELLYVHDKRAPDYNGDRGTMEYQGIDPDVRGPFPSGTRGFNINPA